MVLWPAVALIGFLALTAFVIAMGTRSTARYEQERQLAGAMPAASAGAMTSAMPAASAGAMTPAGAMGAVSV